MYKVMTPSQLKEHNTMLLLLKQKEAEEKEMEENKKQEREIHDRQNNMIAIDDFMTDLVLEKVP